jgi:hypothetical protein
VHPATSVPILPDEIPTVGNRFSGDETFAEPERVAVRMGDPGCGDEGQEQESGDPEERSRIFVKPTQLKSAAYASVSIFQQVPKFSADRGSML